MTKPIKWIRNIAIVIVVLLLTLYIVMKVFVGAVNTPIPGKEFDATTVGTRIMVPEGFSIGLYAEKVENARLLTFTRSGDLLVANPNLDQIILLERDENGDGKADGRRVVINQLNGPNGMDFFDDWLYIAETDAIGRIKFDHKNGTTIGDYQRVVTGLQPGGNHWRKTLRFGDDGLMYVTMGSSCNVCEEEDERRGTMVRYNPDGSNEEIFARGLRNSAGFDWSPVDGKIYATDNGRDLLGDNFPYCELNKVEQGNHYGWPYANNDKVADPDFGKGNEAIIESSIAPAFNFQPHNAPLGITFIRGKSFPQEYHNVAIVALHGSWNRTDKDGYKVVTLHTGENNQIIEKDFLSGLLQGDNAIGRPADVAEGPDGAIYISDDYANVIYRVAYAEKQTEIALPTSISSFNASDTLAAIDPEKKSAMSAEGATLFAQFRCSTCHADSGGVKPLENIGGKYDLVTLAKFIERPNPPMPVYPLTDDQRAALSVFLIETYSE
ncbi:MAG: PQQ-dependent sugar dehydrogenase [Oceanicoccus sp.]